jgi:hypothetical protein
MVSNVQLITSIRNEHYGWIPSIRRWCLMFTFVAMGDKEKSSSIFLKCKKKKE